MSLTIEETKILNSLPENLKEFAELQINKKVSAYRSNELKSKCGTIIIQYYKDTNTKNVDAKILAAQRDELINALKGANKDLTLQEVEKAFKLGVAGESGPYFGGCYKTYVQFLNYYRTRPERERVIKLFLEQTKSVTSDKPLISEEEKEKILMRGAIGYFNEYKENKTQHLAMFASVSFCFLEKIGVINLTKEEKLNLLKEAESEYVVDLQSKKTKREITQKTYEQVLLAMTGNPSVKAIARKMALYQYFDKLIESNTDLKTIINP